ncbi:endo-1,4-beta-xylanase (glycosyl hydrolase family 10) [Streptomyces sp. TLI_235]|nr:endo-1,4-beta-xylanase [Streptomyces sp. TLI_235]PBC71690.1 endo-1,4-beta-xylanase (glycosyl hydrolase family 10) [Streptomyces sp. TLI_235]
MLLPLSSLSAHGADTPLRALASADGRQIGVAVADNRLTGSTAYSSLVTGQFNSVTAENTMKWDAVEPSRGNLDWAAADRLVATARANGQVVRGHTLAWHSQVPGWITNGGFGAAQLRTLLQQHIATEAGRYAGRIYAWDVVNEAFNDDGTRRSSIWQDNLGDGWIADALTWAHQADPAAKLYINDYSIEGVNAKSTALYNLVKSLKQQGVPIDGVGFQAHLVLGQVPADLKTNLQRFADLGVDVAVTELDVRMQTPSNATTLATQAEDYRKVVTACRAVARCVGVTVWGLDDADSWVPGVFPGYGAAALYDENLQAKPALAAVAAAFGGSTAGPSPSTSASPSGSASPGSSPSSSPVPDGCTVAYRIGNQWTGGFTADVTVTNQGTAAIGPWQVGWQSAAGQQVTQGWSAVFTQSGATVTAANPSWAATLAPGASHGFGFNGSWGASNPVPTAFTLNGAVCTVV